VAEYKFSSRNFWRLFHCLVSHNTTEEEAARTKAVWSWMGDHLTTLRKIAGGLGGVHDRGKGLELLGLVWSCARVTSDLPSIGLVREKALMLDGEAVPLLLDEYKEFVPSLTVHPAQNMDAVLQDCIDDWETDAVHNMLEVANRIALVGIDNPKDKTNKKRIGPKEALKYLRERQERGLLIKPNQVLRPINVNKEATTIGEWYDESLNTNFLPTGIFEPSSKREVLLETNSFVGILGYLHDGKSPVARHILYHMAEKGLNVLHVSLENPGIKERNKFILQHAHNPKFGGRYDRLTYAKFRLKLLTPEERQWLNEVGEDFEASIGGQITIEQMGISSWEFIKQKIEDHNMDRPLDAVCIDYLQLIDPPVDQDSDQRARFTAMIKDVRQFQMTFDGGRGLCLISPVQGNETGHDRAGECDGIWDPAGVNNEKELARSMDFIVGVFRRGRVNGLHDFVFSFPKDREDGEFMPFYAHMTGAGWIGRNEAEKARQNWVDPNTEAMLRATNITEEERAAMLSEQEVRVGDNG
jgi:hypothetical protein